MAAKPLRPAPPRPAWLRLPRGETYVRLAATLTTDKLARFIKRDIQQKLKVARLVALGQFL